ncbi:unnamed protein product [Schistosoma mattheei]|uniref:Uncharacterized protein n=1 Tax=Schistosoma mattheei TaxID=31246 RepID=A0A3P7XN75_9TREM|nr:unnamed protein product [Schistosoma mattheei]
MLNRDVWKDPKIYQLIKRHCTFVQIPVDSSEGLRFRSSYSYVQSASHIAILDPFTGEQKMMWTHLNDPKIVYDVYSYFEFHMFVNCVNAVLALSILAFTSASDPPRSSMMLSRCVKAPTCPTVSPSSVIRFVFSVLYLKMLLFPYVC